MSRWEKERETYVEGLTARLQKEGVLASGAVPDLDLATIGRIEEIDRELFLEENPEWAGEEVPDLDTFRFLVYLDRRAKLPADPEGFVRAYLDLRDEHGMDEFFREDADSEAREANEVSNRGNSRLQLGRIEEALGDFDRAVELAPKSAHVHGVRAQALFSIGNLEKALEDVDKAVALSDAGRDLSAPYLIQRSEYLYRIGNHGQAADSLLRASRELEAMAFCPTDEHGSFHLPSRHIVSDGYVLDFFQQAVELAKKIASRGVGSPGLVATLFRVERQLRENEVL